jgi:hypothetical protein
MVLEMKPENWMRSAVASACQSPGSAPCAAASASPAASSDCHSDAEHAVRSPPPQYFLENPPLPASCAVAL